MRDKSGEVKGPYVSVRYRGEVGRVPFSRRKKPSGTINLREIFSRGGGGDPADKINAGEIQRLEHQDTGANADWGLEEFFILWLDAG